VLPCNRAICTLAFYQHILAQLLKYTQFQEEMFMLLAFLREKFDILFYGSKHRKEA
jgi:hypothetical protein